MLRLADGGTTVVLSGRNGVLRAIGCCLCVGMGWGVVCTGTAPRTGRGCCIGLGNGVGPPGLPNPGITLLLGLGSTETRGPLPLGGTSGLPRGLATGE